MSQVATESTLEKLKANQQIRFDRMRLGQAVAEIVRLPSNREIEIALVPLWEQELHQAQVSTASQEFPFSVWNQRIYERWEQYEVLIRSMREPADFERRIFDEVKTMLDVLEPSDVNYLAEQYIMMTDRSSPAIEGFTEEQIEELKKVLNVLDWNELSGKQWYLLKAFLSSLSPEQLAGKYVGSSLTNFLTQMSNAIDSVVNADEKPTSTTTAPDAEKSQGQAGKQSSSSEKLRPKATNPDDQKMKS